MSANEDYEKAKKFMAEPDKGLALVDRVRILITATRIEERNKVFNYGIKLGESRPNWFESFLMEIKHGTFNPVDLSKEPADAMDYAEPLEAIDERYL